MTFRSIETGREYVLAVNFNSYDNAVYKRWEIRGPSWERDFFMARKWRKEQDGYFTGGYKVLRVLFHYTNDMGIESMTQCQESDKIALNNREIQQLNGDNQ